MIRDFTKWRDELLFTGNIVQDSETDVDRDEAERRSGHRYVELLEMVEGDEGDEVFQTIIESMVAEDESGWLSGADQVGVLRPGGSAVAAVE